MHAHGIGCVAPGDVMQTQGRPLTHVASIRCMSRQRDNATNKQINKKTTSNNETKFSSDLFKE